MAHWERPYCTGPEIHLVLSDSDDSEVCSGTLHRVSSGSTNVSENLSVRICVVP